MTRPLKDSERVRTFEKRSCHQCGKRFSTERENAKYCPTRACRQAAYRERQLKDQVAMHAPEPREAATLPRSRNGGGTIVPAAVTTRVWGVPKGLTKKELSRITLHHPLRGEAKTQPSPYEVRPFGPGVDLEGWQAWRSAA